MITKCSPRFELEQRTQGYEPALITTSQFNCVKFSLLEGPICMNACKLK